MPMDGQTHFNYLLTEVSNKFRNDELVAKYVAPPVPVGKESGSILVYGTANLRLAQTRRANKSAARTATQDVSNTAFLVEYHALKDVVTDRDRANYDPPIDADADTTEFLTDQIGLRQEVGAAQVAFTSTTWGTNTSLTSTTSWRYNTTTSDPAVAAHSAASSILLRSGKRPNQAVIGYGLYNLVRDHVSLLDRVKYTQIGQVTPGLIAALWDVDRVVIGTAIQDAGLEGISSSNTAVWGPSIALFMFNAPNPGLKVVSALYMLSRNGAEPMQVRSWRDEEVKGDWIEVETAYQFKAVATAAAYLYHSANL